MNGAHDLGGMQGFGPVQPERNEPVFHEEWEKHLFAVVRAVRTQGIYNIDESRYGIERMPPARYLGSSYYERWLASAERNLVEKGVLTADELEARIAHYRAHPGETVPRQVDPALLQRVLAQAGRPAFRRPETTPPRFAAGDQVVTRNTHPLGHTRLPRYARGKQGAIVRYYGVFVFPDTNARGQGEQPQPLYNVRFNAKELWGESATPGASVHIDLWESYLEPR